MNEVFTENLNFVKRLYGTGLVVTGFRNRAQSELSIPPEVDGIPVVGIYKDAFKGCETLTSVKFPDTLQFISGGAFSGCKFLTTINIPGRVIYIYQYAFYNCVRLTKVSLPGSVSYIGESAFSYCRSLTAIDYFGTESDWENIKIGPSQINLKSLVSFKNAATAGFNRDDTNVSDAVNTRDVTGKGGCSDHLEFQNRDNGYVLTGIGGCHDSDLVIPAVYGGLPVTGIADNAFFTQHDFFTQIKSVVIPGGVTSIGANAFRNCSKLESVVFPEKLTTIGRSAFHDCESLTGINLPQSIIEIGSYAFCGCKSLKSISLPPRLTWIRSGLFKNCTSLTEVEIPKGITLISDFGFDGCKSLSSVNFLGKETEWRSVVIKDYNQAVLSAKVVFSGESVPNEGNRPFPARLPEERVLAIQREVARKREEEAVRKRAEEAARRMEEEAARRMEEEAARRREEEAARKREEEAARKREEEAARKREEEAARKREEEAARKRKEEAARKREEEAARKREEERKKIEALLYVKQGDSYVVAGVSDTSVENPVVPTTYCDCNVIGISEGAFKDCAQIKTISVGKNVTYIGDRAFFGCVSLAKVSLPYGLKHVGYAAFRNCFSLTEVIIPGQIVEIPEMCFNGCKSLVHLTIPQSTLSVGRHAFHGCPSLNDVTYLGDEDDLSRLKIGEYNEPLLSLTANSKSDKELISDETRAFSLLKGDGGESKELDYAENGNGYSVKGIGRSENADVVISSSVNGKPVVKIAGKAFKGCGQIRSVSIPDGVTYIGSDAFWDCKRLEYVFMPASVTYIGEGAFNGCLSLKAIYYFGSEEDWSKIIVGESNSGLRSILSFCDRTDIGCKVELEYQDGEYVVVGIGTHEDSCLEIPPTYARVPIIGIAQNAFTGNSVLREVKIPGCAESIGDNSFAGCEELSRVVIEEGVLSIMSKAFFGCKSLHFVSIPKSVGYIAGDAFDSCPLLQRICYSGTEDEWKKIRTDIRQASYSIYNGSSIVVHQTTMERSNLAYHKHIVYETKE